MWKVQASAISQAAPAEIWKCYADVTRWSTWDADLEFSQLDGSFEVGSSGRVKAKGAPAVKFVLT